MSTEKRSARVFTGESLSVDSEGGTLNLGHVYTGKLLLPSAFQKLLSKIPLSGVYRKDSGRGYQQPW